MILGPDGQPVSEDVRALLETFRGQTRMVGQVLARALPPRTYGVTLYDAHERPIYLPREGEGVGDTVTLRRPRSLA